MNLNRRRRRRDFRMRELPRKCFESIRASHKRFFHGIVAYRANFYMPGKFPGQFAFVNQMPEVFLSILTNFRKQIVEHVCSFR